MTALFISTSFFVNAQQPGVGRRNFDPKQMAERQTTSMVEMLMLSDAQAGKIGEVNLKYALRIDSLRNANQGDFEMMREQMIALRTQQENEQKKYLTGEQFEKWQKFQEERRTNRSQRRRPGNNNRDNAPGK